MTPEKRREAAKRGGETLHRRSVEAKERFQKKLEDRDRAIAILREIRDSTDSTPGEKLDAIALLREIVPEWW